MIYIYRVSFREMAKGGGGGKTILTGKMGGGGAKGQSARNSMFSGLGACFPIKYLNL